MNLSDKKNKKYINSHIILLILMSLVAVIPVNGAIEQRGPLVNISAGEYVILFNLYRHILRVAGALFLRRRAY
jgi:hypothetical protein